jgi:hypothetical protein
MITRYAEGLNYHIDLDGSRAICKVWSRPDLDSARGAALAVEKIAHFQRLARGDADSMLFDLSQAPPVTGPKTQKALSDMLDSWQNAKKPIALVAGPQSIQQLQLRRLLATAAPDTGALFTSLDQAHSWLDGERERRQR